MAGLPKARRQEKLKEHIVANPFITDDELAKTFRVSIQTVRLDRLELGIPELRERMKQVATANYEQVKALNEAEVVGELLDLEIGRSAMSILPIQEGMAFERSNIARGHYLFAQANSLAVAVVDAEKALTGTAKVTFKRPVYLGEKVTAKAVVTEVYDNKYRVTVTSRVNLEEVFRGSFVVFAIVDEGGIDS